MIGPARSTASTVSWISRISSGSSGCSRKFGDLDFDQRADLARGNGKTHAVDPVLQDIVPLEHRLEKGDRPLADAEQEGKTFSLVADGIPDRRPVIETGRFEGEDIGAVNAVEQTGAADRGESAPGFEQPVGAQQMIDQGPPAMGRFIGMEALQHT